MLPNLDKLVAKCRSLGLEPKASGKRLSKDDCVKLLRVHFMPAGGLPYTEVEPMLCFAEWNLKPDEVAAMWKSPNWVAQRKLNGCRAVIHFVKGKGVYAHSRTVSVKTYRFQELTGHLLIEGFVPDFDATVDAEMLIEKPVDTRPYTVKGGVTKTSLHSTTAVISLEPSAAKRLQREQDAAIMFHTFDIMQWGGENIESKSLRERLVILNQFAQQLLRTEIGKFFLFPGVVYTEKEAYLQLVWKEGGEGIILKNLRAPYEASSSRPRDGWVKFKKRIEYDAFVTGFIRGEEGTAWRNLVGALEFSVNVAGNKTHAIAMCTNLTLEDRQKMSKYDATTDTVTLHPAMYGKVAEVSGQDISARSLRLSHATIDRWRPKQGPDAKLPDDCVADLDDLKFRAEWVG